MRDFVFEYPPPGKEVAVSGRERTNKERIEGVIEWLVNHQSWSNGWKGRWKTPTSGSTGRRQPGCSRS